MPTTADPTSSFIDDFSRALDARDAALFVGAGVSQGAGYPGWPGLLADFAKDLNLEIERETDLVSLAQFHVNQHRVRSRLDQRIVDEYGPDKPLTDVHELMAQLPIDTVWTTNYDRMLERAFRSAGKRVDVKATGNSLARPVRGRDVTIYKMHGDVDLAAEAVLTKEDFELYQVEDRGKLFTTTLQGHLIGKQFLFLGFSFTDPNIDYILSRIRALLGKHTPTHYCIMSWPQKPRAKGKDAADYDYNLRRLQLRIDDLKRYGIQAVMIDNYGQIPDILHELNRRAHRRTVFVSGSATDFAPLGQPRLTALAHHIGQALVADGFDITSGFGLGIGGAVAYGAIEQVYRDNDAYINDRLVVRPFPQLPLDHPDRAALYSKYRRDMLRNVGVVVVMAGNRPAGSGSSVEIAPGVLEEVKIARDLGKVVIPIGATGSAAEQLWSEMKDNLDQLFPGLSVRREFMKLGDSGQTNDQIVQALLTIIKRVTRT